MKAGERQVSPTLDGIRRDHVARYEFAAKRIQPGSRVIDFACGVGYGARILADAGHTVRAYDKDNEALDYAARHYWDSKIHFEKRDAERYTPLPEAAAAVCFETVEHLEDPRPLLKAMRHAAPMLIASVPHEDIMPWRRPDGATTAFHFRHYTRAQFTALLSECGWTVIEWHGQAGPESEVEPDIDGRTLIAVCDRGEHAKQPDDEIKAGPHVAIVGLGPSANQYLELTKRAGGRHRLFDETWAINALGDVFACDLVFHMDDVRIQEIRSAARPDSNIAAMLEWIKHSPVPVVTSRKHPDYPALAEFPLEDVLNNLGHDYFNSTAAYAVAFAIHVGAKIISLFGCDFTYPNVHDAEKGRACVEFWLGQAHARGIKINLPQTTTLLDSCYPKTSRLYGYDTVDIEFDVQAGGALKLCFTEREKLPTADEIEALYDHSAPIEKQHLGTKG